MTTVGYPSADFPRPTPFVMDVPDGWKAIHVPDTLVAIIHPEEGEFRPNITVAWQRVPMEETLDKQLSKLLSGLAGLPDYELLDIESGSIGPFPAVTAHTEHRNSAGQLLSQVHLLTLGPGLSEQTRDQYHLTGSCIAAARPEDGDFVAASGGAKYTTLVEMVRSFLLVEPKPRPATIDEVETR